MVLGAAPGAGGPAAAGAAAGDPVKAGGAAGGKTAIARGDSTSKK
jgi:hypothetical protein